MCCGTCLSVCIIILDKVLGLLAGNTINVADLIAKPYAIELVRILQQFGPERGGNKLGRVA